MIGAPRSIPSELESTTELPSNLPLSHIGDLTACSQPVPECASLAGDSGHYQTGVETVYVTATAGWQDVGRDRVAD